MGSSAPCRWDIRPSSNLLNSLNPKFIFQNHYLMPNLIIKSEAKQTEANKLKPAGCSHWFPDIRSKDHELLPAASGVEWVPQRGVKMKNLYKFLCLVWDRDCKGWEKTKWKWKVTLYQCFFVIKYVCNKEILKLHKI